MARYTPTPTPTPAIHSPACRCHEYTNAWVGGRSLGNGDERVLGPEAEYLNGKSLNTLEPRLHFEKEAETIAN